MFKSTFWLSMLLAAFFATSCTTKDVDEPYIPPVPPENLYEIHDAALGDYLIFNSGLPASNVNSVPAGTALKQDGKYYINKVIAKTAPFVYLVKNETQIGVLRAAGVPTADVKIVSLDGIQLFTAVRQMKLTSNNIAGTLDLSMLPKLDTLEMNGNFVTGLIVPNSITRLRCGPSTDPSVPDNSWLLSIDLSACTALRHVFLANQHIPTDGIVLPTTYPNLRELDLSGNPGAPFTIPSSLFAQLTTRLGVQEEEPDNYDGPMPKESYYEIKDVAFGEYLVYLTEVEPDDALKLPAGTAQKYTNNKLYIKKSVAATATLLNISKAAAFITKLKNAGVASAEVKVADADGLQFFTALQTIVATSNAFTEPLQLANLKDLSSLTVRTAGLSVLDVKENTQLKILDIQGSASASLGRMQAMDMSTNTALESVNLSANEIDPTKFVLPTSAPNLKSLNMGNNKVGGTAVTFTIPAALYDQLNTGASDRAGLVRGS